MKSKTIIFDMDGTLVDTSIPIVKTINFVRKKFGLKELDKEIILEKINCPDTHSPQFFYGVDEFSDRHIDLFESYYQQCCTLDISLYSGIKDLIQEIEQTFHLSVATNASSHFAKKILHSQNIVESFSYIIGANDVKESKPHPEMLFKVMEKFSQERAHYIFIGDSFKDELAAKNAGIEYLMVDWGFSDHRTHHRVHNSAEELKKSIYEILL